MTKNRRGPVVAVVVVFAIAMGCLSYHLTRQGKAAACTGEGGNGNKSTNMATDSSVAGIRAIKSPKNFKSHTTKNGKMLIGNFTGRGLDTLRVVPADVRLYNRYLKLTEELEEAGDNIPAWQQDSVQEELNNLYDYLYSFKIVSSDPSVPAIPFENGSFTDFPQLVSEGDLDGDGLDDVGCLRQQMAGGEQAYRIFTWRDGQWKYLVPTLLVAGSMYPPEFDVAQPTGTPGKVLVHYPDYSAPGSCAANVKGKPKVISVSLHTLKRERFLDY